MTRNAIIELVRARMDEIHPLEQGETIADVQIDKQLNSAAVSLIEMLPSVLANPVSADPLPEVTNYVDGFSLDLTCPDDFVRIHRLKLKDWTRPVIELMPDGITLLYQQDYDYIKATIRRPAAALYRKDGTEYITCYPAPVADPIPDPPPDPPVPVVYFGEFVYVAKPEKAEDLDESLIDMLTWKVAGTIYTISRQPDLAKVCYEMLNNMIETKLKYRS